MRRMSRHSTGSPLRVLVAWAILAAITLASAAAAAATTLEQIRERHRIVFAYRDGAAPFSFKDRDGRVRGYSIELCAGLASAVQRQPIDVPLSAVALDPGVAPSTISTIQPASPYQTSRGGPKSGTSTIIQR